MFTRTRNVVPTRPPPNPPAGASQSEIPPPPTNFWFTFRWCRTSKTSTAATRCGRCREVRLSFPASSLQRAWRTCGASSGTRLAAASSGSHNRRPSLAVQSLQRLGWACASVGMFDTRRSEFSAVVRALALRSNNECWLTGKISRNLSLGALLGSRWLRFGMPCFTQPVCLSLRYRDFMLAFN